MTAVVGMEGTGTPPIDLIWLEGELVRRSAPAICSLLDDMVRDLVEDTRGCVAVWAPDVHLAGRVESGVARRDLQVAPTEQHHTATTVVERGPWVSTMLTRSRLDADVVIAETRLWMDRRHGDPPSVRSPNLAILPTGHRSGPTIRALRSVTR